ncbi:MAG: hypothetical protein VX241_03900, partial [Pseudomonadota bacterium]|nr:hypothetical protein [Pseudomonadota bacterium]
MSLYKLLTRVSLVVMFSASMFFSTNLFAQASEQSSADQVEEIIVTGSRIKTANPDSFAPVSIIDQEDILLSGKISIGEVLLELP